ncbi:MAG: hypothetical protein JW874_11080 [Spirochaetales bacterium]|nr:hypothetical protein [Spirochaetales bacterium]
MKRCFPAFIPVLLCLVFSSCSGQKTPEQCINKFIRYSRSTHPSRATEMMRPDKLFLPLETAYKEIGELSKAGKETSKIRERIYARAGLEFRLELDKEKYYITTVVHPRLTVLFFLDRLRDRDFEAASRYLPAEIREEFLLMLDIINGKESDKNSPLFRSCSILGSTIQEDRAEVRLTMDGTEISYSLIYENGNWLILFPVRNIWD